MPDPAALPAGDLEGWLSQRAPQIHPVEPSRQRGPCAGSNPAPPLLKLSAAFDSLVKFELANRPGRTLRNMADFEFADDFLPVYDVSDAVATVADADRARAWRALLDVDLLRLGREAPVVGMLGALRVLPEVIGQLLHGERPAKPPESMRLRDLPSIPMAEGGWILLGERPGEEIALGLAGKFWRPVIEWARIESADEFRAFEEPGFAKTVYDLSVSELEPNKTLLSGLMRTTTTDEHARRWFRRYWTFGVGSGAHILVGALLDSARRVAEGDRDG